MGHAVVSITVDPVETGREIVIAELSELDFEGFLETDTGVEAYIPQSRLELGLIDQLFDRLNGTGGFKIGYVTSVAEEKNWNEEWERNFNPVEIGGLCRIRAPFHEAKPGFQQEVVIMPRMSFGTGHHATTALMVEYLMTSNITGPLLDMGCGTGVLAILARKLGLNDITAIDIDDWAVENTPGNCKLNHVNGIELLQGDATLLGQKQFNTILANINRNVLLEDIPTYSYVLNSTGSLFLSGFFEEDLPMIREGASDSGLIFEGNLAKDNWAAAHFTKG